MKIKEAEASEIYKAEYGGERLEGEEKEREGKLVSTEGLPWVCLNTEPCVHKEKLLAGRTNHQEK